MPTDDNKTLVRRFYEEMDRGNLEALDTLVAEDYLDHSPSPFAGLAPERDGLKQAFKIFLEATPGFHRIEEQIAEGDKVVTRLTYYGKHERDLPEAPRTGNYIKVTSITIHRIANRKLVETWAEKDLLRFMIQIGVLPGPERDGSSTGRRS
jgi:predicted ester cyclase